MLYSFIFTNLSFKIERFSNEEKSDDKKNISSTNALFIYATFIKKSIKSTITRGNIIKETDDDYQLEKTKSFFYTILIFLIISFAFLFGFYEENMSYVSGHIYAFGLLVSLIIYRVFLISLHGTFVHGPKIIPLLNDLRSWCWIYYAVMIFFGVYVFFTPFSELGNYENFSKRGLESLVVSVQKFFSSFIKALMKPLYQLSDIIKKTKFTFTSLIMTFFSLAIMFCLVLIPVLMFLAINSSVFITYDIKNTYNSMKQLIGSKRILLKLIAMVLFVSYIYGSIWYSIIK